MIYAGILLIFSVLITFIGLFFENFYALIFHCLTFIIGIASIIILFIFESIILYKILAIIGISFGIIGGIISAKFKDNGNALAFILILVGLILNMIVGVSVVL